MISGSRFKVEIFEDMVARLQKQQQNVKEEELSAVSLTSPDESGEASDSGSITVRFDGDGVDVTLTRGNVVLHGDDEALVTGPDGHHLFRFDPSGNVAGSLFVTHDGEERAVDEAIGRQNLRTVESARIYWEEALAHLDLERVQVRKLFDV